MDSALVAVLINAGVAGVVVVLLIIGWLVPKWVYSKLESENASLREALALERQRNGEVAGTHSVTNQLIGALVDLAGERHQPVTAPVTQPAGQETQPGLTWKDLA